jgi:methyl-accepting chemotaxis protein
MRKNLPVTQNEYPLREGMTIVSRTDLKGRIVYFNDDFREASGFEADELHGQPHNLVRHPDMPEEAFADLWATLKAGRPWTGMVKNRRKNGDHYWVVANATPVMEGGVVTGYLSVRTRPTAQQVSAADALYRRFTEGRAAGLAIREGKVVSSGVRSWGRALSGWLDRTSLRTTYALQGLMQAGVVGLAALAGLQASWPLAIAAALLQAVVLVAGARHASRLLSALRTLGTQLDGFAQGRFDGVIDSDGHDELSQALLALRRVQTRVGFEFNDAKMRAAQIEQQRLAEQQVAGEVKAAVDAATRATCRSALRWTARTPSLPSCAARSTNWSTPSAAPSPRCARPPTSWARRPARCRRRRCRCRRRHRSRPPTWNRPPPGCRTSSHR